MVDIDAKNNDTWVNVCHILKTKGPQKPCSWNGFKKKKRKEKSLSTKKNVKGGNESPNSKWWISF